MGGAEAHKRVDAVKRSGPRKQNNEHQARGIVHYKREVSSE